MKRSPQARQKKTIISRIDDLMILTAHEFQVHDLPNFHVKKGREKEFLDATVSLADQGCNPVTLSWALRLGQAAKGKNVGAIPTAKRIKTLALSLDHMADEIERIEKSGFMVSLHGKETAELERNRGLNIENIEDLGQELPHLDLQRWLRKKAEMYRSWAKLASENKRPRSGTMLTKLEYLFPAVYVKRMTGKAGNENLVRLFDTIGITVDAGQLRRELTQLQRSYIWTYVSIVSMLELVKDRLDCYPAREAVLKKR